MRDDVGRVFHCISGREAAPIRAEERCAAPRSRRTEPRSARFTPVVNVMARPLRSLQDSHERAWTSERARGALPREHQNEDATSQTLIVPGAGSANELVSQANEPERLLYVQELPHPKRM